MIEKKIDISEFDYPLPDERIARFPTPERDASKLLVWRDATSCSAGCCDSPEGTITETRFSQIGSVLPEGSVLVFNDTRVVRARLVMHKATQPHEEPKNDGPTRLGARIEILCLEPLAPADYERAFAARGRCEWLCMVGNLKRWKSGPLEIVIPAESMANNHKTSMLRAWRTSESQSPEQTVRFEWDTDQTFGQLLETLGRVPIPPYLGRDSQPIDNTRYQTVYAVCEGSVAAPTAGLHFTPELIQKLEGKGFGFERVTLHVGAGTFLPVKSVNALDHAMHTEHFEVTLAAIERLRGCLGSIIAVGTTSVRTLESLAALAWRIVQSCGVGERGCFDAATALPQTVATAATATPRVEIPVGQFESADIPAEFDGTAALAVLAEWMRARGLEKLAASTQIMIFPNFRFRLVRGIVTNFHQPKSTLLLLVSAFVDDDKHAITGGKPTSNAPRIEWRRIYDYALGHDFRFLSYGDSSLLLR